MEFYKDMDKVSVSDPDPDPCGSVLKWLPWIRSRIHIWQYGSGSGSRTVKMVSKKEKNLRFQVKKSISHFAEGLIVFTTAWESSINPSNLWLEKKIPKFCFIGFWSWKNLDRNPDPDLDPYRPKMLDPDPYQDQNGSKHWTSWKRMRLLGFPC